MNGLRTALRCISVALCAITFAATSVRQGAGTSAAPRMLAAYYGYDNCLGIADTNGNGNVDEAQAAGCNVKVIPGTTTLVTNVRTPQQLVQTCTYGNSGPGVFRRTRDNGERLDDGNSGTLIAL